MTVLLRSAAVAIAIAALLDPAVALSRRQPIAIEVSVPRPSDPGHAAALAAEGELRTALAGLARIDSPEPPQAFVVIGNGALPDGIGAPVFVLPAERPVPEILAVRAPVESVPGQLIPIRVELRGVGLDGRTTVLQLREHDTVIDRVEHRWTAADSVEVRFTYIAPAAGLHRLRIVAETPGGPRPTLADTAVAVRQHAVRVLAYEPRPSWALAFARRALEADPAFSVDSVSRMSRTVAAVAGDASKSLAGLALDRYDALLIGAVDELSEADLAALDRFASEQGGQVVLVPDRRLPERVRARFALPELEERLSERPVTLTLGDLKIRASELLLAPEAHDRIDVLASVADPGRERPALLAVDRGEGRIALSGLLDAWRFRDDADGGFERVWRSLIADLGIQAPPRLRVRVEPAVARPGDELRVTATWRASELQRRAGRIDVPEVRAAIVSSDGAREFLRLWPGIRPGLYEARIPAPPLGRYLVSVSGEGMHVDAPLVVEPEVVHPTAERAAAEAFTARATGGAVVEDVSRLRPLIERIAAVTIDEPVHPMRSAWWIVPFAGFLTGEWLVRRRRGQR